MRRRTVLSALLALLVVIGLGSAVMAASSGSAITRPRLERSLPVVFANLYTEQAQLLGRSGVNPASLQARAMCDKGGVTQPDVGPSATWICLMSWTDPNNPMPHEGYGKFELNVHSNGCYTAIGQTKLDGFLTLTDTSGRTVSNPVFEFDSCLDPRGDSAPTGVHFPSALTVLSTTVASDGRGHPTLQVSCGTGADGCSGSVSAQAGSTDLGTVPFSLEEETTSTLTLPTALSAIDQDVTFTVTTTDAVGPSDPVTLSTAS